jgi:hypothetical protein
MNAILRCPYLSAFSPSARWLGLTGRWPRAHPDPPHRRRLRSRAPPGSFPRPGLSFSERVSTHTPHPHPGCRSAALRRCTAPHPSRPHPAFPARRPNPRTGRPNNRAHIVCCLSGLAQRASLPSRPFSGRSPLQHLSTDPPYRNTLPLPVVPSAKRTLSCLQPMSSIHPLFGPLHPPLSSLLPSRPAGRHLAAPGAAVSCLSPFSARRYHRFSPCLLVLTVCVFSALAPGGRGP